jgi:hypothetical protein
MLEEEYGYAMPKKTGENVCRPAIFHIVDTSYGAESTSEFSARCFALSFVFPEGYAVFWTFLATRTHPSLPHVCPNWTHGFELVQRTLISAFANL